MAQPKTGAGAVRAAVLGAGFIAHVHLDAVRAAGGVVVGVAGREPGAALQAMAQAERAAASASELIEAPDVEVVHICTPNDSHFDLAQQALLAGKHVVCEKPLATTLAQAARLTDLAAEMGVVTAVPFVYRYYAMVREVRERVRNGEAGRLSMIHGYYLQDWLARDTDNNWRVDPRVGGASRVFADIGVHWMDLAEFTSGQRVTRLNAQLLTVFPKRQAPQGAFEVLTEDAATLSFETDGGAIGSVVLSQVAHGRTNRLWLSLDGTEASFVFDHNSPERLWVGGRSANRLLWRSPQHLSPTAASYSRLPAGHPQGFQDCFNAFVADVYSAVRGGSPDGLPGFADGRRAAELTETVLASASSRSWVEVPSFGRSSTAVEAT
ncbi:MAG: Gfo/Idh/MocA family oxidoreductase [Actinomycetota bacterium]|nr:Gfo/Idh/MocA family oxidoreductase [Actinomycetota bacterium]